MQIQLFFCNQEKRSKVGNHFFLSILHCSASKSPKTIFTNPPNKIKFQNQIEKLKPCTFKIFLLKWSQYKTSRLIQIWTSVVISMIMIMRITQKIAYGKPQFVLLFPNMIQSRKRTHVKERNQTLNTLSVFHSLEWFDCSRWIVFPLLKIYYTISRWIIFHIIQNILWARGLIWRKKQAEGSEQSILFHSFTLPSETENPSAALSLPERMIPLSLTFLLRSSLLLLVLLLFSTMALLLWTGEDCSLLPS